MVSALIATSAVTASYDWVAGHRLLTLPGTVLPWVVAFFGLEFAYYWWHRLSHEVNFLWAAHVVHHQSEDYNLAVALRQSVTTWLTTLPFYLPLALLGVPTTHFLVMLGISTLYQFWIHTELVPPLGWFERVFNTPALHRVHHAINPGYLDRNHGAMVSFWDELFGTYQRETEPCVFGTTRPIDSFNPLWAQVETFVDLWRLARRAPSFVDAVRVFVGSPAWRPTWMGDALKRDFSRKYERPASRKVCRYALSQWVIVVLVVFAFILWGGELSWVSRVAVSGFVVHTLATIPALLEAKSWAKPLEAVRLVSVPALVTLLLAFG
jgi:sterol desaturase/sphingolipid hydroxylase (fatty acid hydroxylase superfamily)